MRARVQGGLKCDVFVQCCSWDEVTVSTTLALGGWGGREEREREGGKREGGRKERGRKGRGREEREREGGRKERGRERGEREGKERKKGRERERGRQGEDKREMQEGKDTVSTMCQCVHVYLLLTCMYTFRTSKWLPGMRFTSLSVVKIKALHVHVSCFVSVPFTCYQH